MKTIVSTAVQSKSDLLSHHQKTMFDDAQSIQTVEMEPGDALWRFVSQKKKNRFSDCWVDRETMKALMEVFRSWGDFSEKTKKKVVHDNLAILEHWSKLNWRVKIEFKKSVIAYVGATGPQKHFSDQPEVSQMFKSKVYRTTDHRIGGFKQYVIPRFKGIKESSSEEFATISHFAHL